MGVAIRPATPEDVPGVQRVARRGWHAAYDDVLGPTAVDRQVDAWYDESTVRDAVERPSTTYVVAVDDERVVGYASGAPANGPTDPATARLETIYVDPERWGEGIGSRLLAAVTERLRERGFRRVVISVLAANDLARAFYEANGFDVLERRTTSLVGEEYEELVYAGPLPPIEDVVDREEATGRD